MKKENKNYKVSLLSLAVVTALAPLVVKAFTATDATPVDKVVDKPIYSCDLLQKSEQDPYSKTVGSIQIFSDQNDLEWNHFKIQYKKWNADSVVTEKYETVAEYHSELGPTTTKSIYSFAVLGQLNAQLIIQQKTFKGRAVCGRGSCDDPIPFPPVITGQLQIDESVQTLNCTKIF